MKKLAVAGGVVLLVGMAYWFFNHSASGTQPKDYSDLLKASESTLVSPFPAESPAAVTLNDMLAAGINTYQGVLQSYPLESGSVERYALRLGNKDLSIQGVDPLLLVKAFFINEQQVLLLGYNQGGNQCAIRYQFVSLSDRDVGLSKPFGNCLPLQKIEESSGMVIVTMPANNPYLGADVTVSYQYADGEVKELQAAPSVTDLRHKFATLSASQILQIAGQDGCYQGGVLLDDNACGGGRKYCTMFKHLTKPVKNADYQLLKSFCS